MLERLEDGAGFHVVNAASGYGTPLAVRRLRQTLERYHERFPDAAPVLIGDLSRRRGGRLGPHVSHRSGRDADVRLILKRPTDRLVDASPRTLDVERTWFLMLMLIETGDVEYIFLNRRLQRAIYDHAVAQGLSAERLEQIFQYPRSRRHRGGIIRHEPGHLGHFHVRFRRARPDETPLPVSRRRKPAGPCQIAALAWSRTECRGLAAPLL